MSEWTVYVGKATIFDPMEERAIENEQISQHQIITILDYFCLQTNQCYPTWSSSFTASSAWQCCCPWSQCSCTGKPRYPVWLLWQVLGCACHICLACWCEARCWMENLALRDARLCNGGWELCDRTTQHHSIPKILTACLPKKVSNVIKIHWRPVFSMMEEGIGHIPENLTPEIVNDLHKRAMEYLQTRVSYIFWKDRLHHNDWVVAATWAKYLSRSVIFLKCSKADKGSLPVMKLSNRRCPFGLKCRNGAAMATQIVVGGDQQQRRRRCRAGLHNTFIALSNNDSSEG